MGKYDCPECGQSLRGEPVYGPEGDELTPHDSPAAKLAIQDGVIVLQAGLSCPECDWEQFVTFNPDEVDNNLDLVSSG